MEYILWFKLTTQNAKVKKQRLTYSGGPALKVGQKDKVGIR